MGVRSAAHILISFYKVHKPQHDESHFLSTWGRTAVRHVPVSANYRGLVVNARIANTELTGDQDEDVTNYIKIHRPK